MRRLSFCPAARLAFALAAGLPLFAGAQQVKYSNIHRDHEQSLPQNVTGGTAKLRARIAAGTGVSLVSADFDEDGSRDLVTGYSTASGGALLLQRGNPRALAPTPTEAAMFAAGQLVAPYVAKSELIQLPVTPSLLSNVDFSGHGHQDLLAAAKGDSAVYYLHGKGDGSFMAPQALPLAGSISALAVWTSPTGDNLLVAGVCGAKGCGLQFLDRDGVTKAFIATPAAVTALQTGRINFGSREDLALIAGGQVLILDGDTALKASPTLETLPVSGAAAIALGTFVPDHHFDLQIAVLGTDATLHVIARAGIDATYDPSLRAAGRPHRLPGAKAARKSLIKRTGQPWTEAETVPNVGPGGPAIMLRARLSGSGNDDLAVMAGSQYVTVAHPIQRVASRDITTPVVTVDSTSQHVTAALAARISPDARLGIVSLATGAHPLTVTAPTAYRTFTVNTINDDVPSATTTANCIAHSTCSLRDAVTAANEDRNHNAGTGIDTINIPAGSYVLSKNNVGYAYDTQAIDYSGSVNIHLEIDAGMNLVGLSGCTNAGTPSVPTSCQATINANLVDLALIVGFGSFYDTSYSDYEPYTFDAFLSNLAITRGKNPNSQSSSNCSQSGGYCDFFGGSITWTDHGPSNLVMNNVLVTNGIATEQGGGGIEASYDNNSGTGGTLEIDNSSFVANQAPNNTNSDLESEGGGALDITDTNAPQSVPLILTNDYFSGNSSVHQGGAVDVTDDSGQVTITNSVFVNNTSGPLSEGGNTFGGGLFIHGLLTMTGNTISGNKAYGFGGGLYLDFSNSEDYAQTVNANNFVNNSIAGVEYQGTVAQEDGGGMCIGTSYNDSASTQYALHYNRFHGNTGGAHTGLGVGCQVDFNGGNTTVATVSATDNWWGCMPTTATNGNGGTLAGTGCDTAGITSSTTGPTLSVSPYTTLTLGLNSTSINAGSSVIATASLGQDSASTPLVYSSGNDTAYNATTATLPSAIISTFTLTNTATPTYNPSSAAFSATANTAVSYAAATATGTANAAGTGTATVTVDGATVTRTYTVVASDQTISDTHSPTNFKAGDTADTYTLTVANIGTGSTTGTVTVTDTLPSGFTATAASGTNWSCSTGTTVTCTSSQTVAYSVTFPAITITVSVASTDVGSYTNNFKVSGGGELNTNNDTGSDSTAVVGEPTITEAFSPATIVPNATSTVTFTLGNPSANSVSLTGVAFSDPLPTTVKIVTAATTTCSGGIAAGAVNGTTVSLSGATIAAGATCTVTAGVTSPTIGSYPDTTGNVTATNSNAGGTGAATLTVSVTPTRAVFTAPPPTPITAGDNAGTVTVALEDTAGNINTADSASSVKLVVTNTGTYSQTYTVTVANGVATFNLSSVALTASGTYTYSVSSGTLTTGASETVNPGAATSLVVTGLSTFTAPQMSGTATVKADDAYGNTAIGFTGTVTLSSTDASATFSPSTYTYAASDAGTHAFTITFNTAGTQALTATSGSAIGSETGVLVEDAIWVLNMNDSIQRLTDAGVETFAGGSTTGTSPYGAVAFDNTGNAWVTQYDSSGFTEFNAAGTVVTSHVQIGGLSNPTSLFIDGSGQVWFANKGNGSVSVISTGGAAVSPATGYQPGALSTPTGILVDSSGSVWVTNSGTSTVTKIFGAAAPAVAPTVTGTVNKTLGTVPNP